MANYYGAWRTNSFRVKSEAKFLEWFQGIDGSAEVRDEGDGYRSIFQSSSSDDGSIPTHKLVQAHGLFDSEHVNMDIYSDISEHLRKGEVAVFMEVGHEKLRYLCGYAVAVRSDGKIITVSIDDIYDKIKTEWGMVADEIGG